MSSLEVAHEFTMLLGVIAGSLLPVFVVGRRQMEAEPMFVNLKPQAALTIIFCLVAQIRMLSGVCGESLF